uniref:Large ribosomal subunit protein uL5c n=1 Tax=Astrosyne radiata TaxID=1158023 RepID=A0A2U9NTA3_9STRA|nr:ribosomal protein L5 [Astrosyne radiata]AWT40361.1 ribosomal protein L5 [Astrosyne radiata]
MLYQHLLEETGEIYALLENIKREYQKSFSFIVNKRNKDIFKNCHNIPKLKAIQINRGVGLEIQNKNILKKNINELEIITGQKPIITKSKKAISSFKIRENMNLGLQVTLRKEKMYTFLTKLIFFTFAQIRDFRGLSIRSFDKAGNYTIGVKEQLIFPEIEFDDVDKIQGFTITFVFENTSSEIINKILSNIILFKFFRFPINECGYYEKYTSISEIDTIWSQKRSLKRKRWSQE